ncbi:MAG: aspartate-semialdehyde dehydrogenase [Candidatus Cloacimonadales bacterium]
MRRYNLAIVGATGAVGQEMLKILQQREFPVGKLTLLASSASAGKKLFWKEQQLEVQTYQAGCFDEVDIALFSAGAEISKKLAPIAVDCGCVVIDNSSAFRQQNDIPLVVPEINAAKLAEHEGIIANPNCSTIQLVAALDPIRRLSRINKIVVSTYQAVSGSGLAAVQELKAQSKAVLAGKKITRNVYPHQIAFNAIPQIDSFESSGYTKEEMKMIHETRKIFADQQIEINPTAVRIPVFNGHSESVYIETEKPLALETIRAAIRQTAGLKLVDEVTADKYPLALMTEFYDEVLVGRLRKDLQNPRALNLWIVANNLRKGAALNAIQIAEKLLELQLL